jgi:hypothetical protein
MRRRTIAVGLLSLAAACGVAAEARAGGDQQAAAQALFNKGRDAAKRGDLATACAAFEESERLEPAPGTLFNLGDCEEKRGHLAAAWQSFQEAFAKLPPSDKRRSIVEARVTALKARLPMLAVRLAPDAPAGTTVTRDAIELREASLGVSLPLDPGTHQVVAAAAGHSERQFTVELKEGEQKELVVAPGPPTTPLPAPSPAAVAPAATAVVAAAPKAAPPAGPKQASASPRAAGQPRADTKTLGYVVGGVGVAGIGAALVLGGVALGKKDTLSEDHCNAETRTCDSQKGVDAASSGATLATASTVSFIVGAAAVGVGAYFILTSGESHSTAVGASAAVGGGSIRLVHRF